LADVLTKQPGFEAELVARYSGRLLAFARRQLPARVRSRVDPEDVVQSVYRSFFRRLNEGLFAFQESHDVWRLLAAMTFRKAHNATKFHLRERRDVRRERPMLADPDFGPSAEAQPGLGDLDALVECLEELLNALPETRREILVRRLEGESVAEIARRLDCSRQTVYRVLEHVQEVAARHLELFS
jgi:RNA polymerase sigma-70 factor (ECF subfamily)